MAPEVANDVVEPNAASDRFSLAVLLFFIFVIGHPLKGKRELTCPTMHPIPINRTGFARWNRSSSSIPTTIPIARNPGCTIIR
jgi:hypothetical protein